MSRNETQTTNEADATSLHDGDTSSSLAAQRNTARAEGQTRIQIHQLPSTATTLTSTLATTDTQATSEHHISGDDDLELLISSLNISESDVARDSRHDTVEYDSVSDDAANKDASCEVDSDASVDVDDDKREDRYFTGHSTKSEDFLFDIHAEGDPLEIYPIDVQTYLRLMGFKIGFREQFQEGDETLARAEIAAGLGILREAQANKSGLFFPPDHQFSPEAFKTIPFYPWLYGIPAFILDKIESDTEEWSLDDEISDQYDDWKTSMFKGNVRVPLPPYLHCIPGVGGRWDQIIAFLYGYESPIHARIVLWGHEGRSIVRFVRERFADRWLGPSPKAPKGSRSLMGSWDYLSIEELYGGVMPIEPMMSDEQLRAMFRSSYFE